MAATQADRHHKCVDHSLDTQPQASAMERCLGIEELAEAIFLELPPQQALVNVQRVSRRWRAVVLHSLPLQQALFFRPTDPEALQFVKDCGEHRGGSWRAKAGSDCPRKIYEHPLMAALILEQRRPTPAVARPEASWRRQFLTQPPLAVVTMSIGGSRITVEAVDVGVTMGRVYEMAQLCPASPVSISDWSLWESYEAIWRRMSAAAVWKLWRTC